ncbi:hypothetical protein [Spirosoma flavum]|uniref:Lipoprotein n=1 Tax=Spirosoma flavum TaxID=2048557 RepID=A0ABW6AHC2_9BACT
MTKSLIAIILLLTLAACEGGSFKKKNCKSCETLTYGKTGQVNKNDQQVCGDDELSAFVIANTISNSSLTVVTTCK